MKDSYSQAAEYYDLLYSLKDYSGEAEAIAEIVRERLNSSFISLLDVACGTGIHVKFFQQYGFKAEGMDISEPLLKIARKRNPGTVFYTGNMIDFNLRRQYSVITCLFSAIGYARTIQELESTAKCMSDHLLPGGLLLVEPWLTPDAWKPGTVHLSTVDEPDLKIVRMNTSDVASDDRVSLLNLHYLIGTSRETKHLLETHELGLFTEEEMFSAFKSAGLIADFDPKGLTGRGLYICRKES